MMRGGYSRWEDAMVAQEQQLAWMQSELGRRYTRFFEQDIQSKHAPSERMPDGFLPALLNVMVRDADPVYVSADVTEMIDRARETFRPEPLLASDPFTTSGFAVFPRPLMLPDAAKNNRDFLPIRAVSWLPVIDEDDPTVGCVWVAYFVHEDDDLAVNGDEGAPSMSKANPNAKMTLVHVFQWSFGSDPNDLGKWRDHMAADDLADHMKRGRAQTALVQVLWRLGQQVYKSQERAPRGLWRDARRRGMQTKDVTVITLRRSRDPHEFEPTGRTLDHQFLVRGYWRRQNTREGIRQVWVRPHVKGPEGTEFVQTKRVFEMVR